VKAYLYGGLALALLAALSASHLWAYQSGKQAVLARLKDDRIRILKDGAEIDDKVLAADDDGLLCLLTECLPE
jgi:hypothetical protein